MIGVNHKSELSTASIAQIEVASGWRVHRVEVFDLPEGKVIVKGHRPLRGPWRHRVLNLLAALFRAPMMKAVPVHGGAQSQEVELRRLAALKAAGQPVPRVLHVAPDYFVMNFLGKSHLAGVLSSQGFAAYDLWRTAAEQIVQVHAAGQYLSQCFGRNIIVDQASSDLRFAGMIDFEDDPLEVMSLQEAQVRDWLVFLQSTVYLLNAPPDALSAGLQELFSKESRQLRQALLQGCRKLVWLRHLPRSRNPWGKDTVMLQAAAQAMHGLLRDMKN
jgi:tRNA A-37 threonylcarbamoyl transferase component Bud32